MTSKEMLREFKVGLDKVDSDTYPEIYNEQIFMFINKAVDELVNEGRRIFEKDQTITDNLKSLIPKEPLKLTPVKREDADEYLFDLKDHGYLFYIRASINTVVGSKAGRAQVKVVQHDDIEVVLQDPYNKPKPNKVPITFSRDTITAYASPTFKINTLYLTFVKKPAIVNLTTDCDIDTQLHYSIIDRAIQFAAVSLGMIKQQ